MMKTSVQKRPQEVMRQHPTSVDIGMMEWNGITVHVKIGDAKDSGHGGVAAGAEQAGREGPDPQTQRFSHA